MVFGISALSFILSPQCAGGFDGEDEDEEEVVQLMERTAEAQEGNHFEISNLIINKAALCSLGATGCLHTVYCC